MSEGKPWMSFQQIELRRRAQEIEDLKRERTEFAAALITALQFLGDMRRGFAQLDGQENRYHWQNLDAAISVLQREIADPAVCLKEHDAAKDAEIRQLRGVLAEVAREILRPLHPEWERVFKIAKFLGYGKPYFGCREIDEFLASTCVEEPVKA